MQISVGPKFEWRSVTSFRVPGPDRILKRVVRALAYNVILQAHGEHELGSSLVHRHDLLRRIGDRLLNAAVRVRVRVGVRKRRCECNERHE